MTTSTRFGFCAFALFSCLSIGLGGCTKTPDRGSDLACDALDPACNVACTSDLDCASPNRQLICADDGFCQAICRSSADCNGPHDAFDGAPWKGCEFGGCTCVDFTCLVPDCFTSEECGAKVCRSGRCQDADTGFDRCEVYPGYAVLGAGGTRTFTVVAYAGDRPVLVGEKASWSAASGAVRLASTDASAMRATFVGEAATQGAVQAVRATVGSTSCVAEVEVLAQSSAPLRAVLVDEASGRLLSGATLVADTPQGRLHLAEEPSQPGSYVAADGSAVPEVGLTLSAFHPDFDSATVAGLLGRDLLVPMRRAAGINKGGVRGAITSLTGASGSNLSAGFVGFSVQGSLLDLSLDQFMSETVIADVSIAGLVDMPGMALPSGVVIGAKDTYFALGSAGPCSDADKARAGLCGNQSAFSLGFSLPVTDLAPLASAFTGEGPIDYGALLSQAMPILAQVELGMVRDVPFDLVPAASFSAEALATLDMTPSVAMSRNIALSLPALPELAGEATGVVIGAALALVEDRGFVPLGLGAGVAESAGGIESVQLQIAAPQGGVEGSPFVLVAVALPAGGTLADGALALSGVVAPMAAPDGALLPELAGDFIGIPSGGVLELSSDSGRRAVRGIEGVEGAGIYRLLFTLPSGHRWSVTFGGGDVELPRPPEGFEDLNPDTGAVPFVVQAARLSGNAGIDALFALVGEEGSARLNALLRAFSIHDPAAVQASVP